MIHNKKTMVISWVAILLLFITCLKSIRQVEISLNMANEYASMVEELLIIRDEESDKINSLERQLRDVRNFNYTEEEILLLAKCVQTEAGKYNRESQRYITQVILNRVYSPRFPNTIKEVIYQKSGNVPQFSVAYNGMLDKCEVDVGTLNTVYSVLLNGTDLPSYVHYFYSECVRGNWVNTLNTYDTKEGTVFAYHSKEDL